MIRDFTRTVAEDFAEGGRMISRALQNLRLELADLGQDPALNRQGVVVASAVVLATVVALYLEMESPWWAAISAFMSMMSTGAGSVRRGLLRLVGTIAGALVGYILGRWLPYDHVALCLFLGGMTMLGVMAMQVSPHGLAWLFLAITSIMVLLSGLNNPLLIVETAYYRVFDVAIGVAAAILMANLFQDWHADRPPAMPGWRHLLGAQWPALLHGARAGISVVIVLIVWILLDLPQVAEMTISIAVVMSAPVITYGGLGTRHAVAERSLHRFIGCLIGGVLALAVLGLDLTSFMWWLVLVAAGVWVGAYLQGGRHGVGYLGTQSAFVYVITLIQGPTPPTSIMPGIDRFAGIAGGLGILLLVSLLLWPSDDEDREAISGPS
ncbi:FUSC family protein [Reyranella sp.]|uniref:FUSC family protein n=1 Tax=Reyranella sp. TaxID=1929291 RepID=UPI003784E3F2